jgi:hypothetical protein
VVMAIAIASAAKADRITITGMTPGLSLSGLGDDGTGDPGLDALNGAAFTNTQIVNGGSIDIDHLVDTIHILSAAPLTFTFNTVSVLVEVIPTDIAALGPRVLTGELNAKFTVVPDSPVPEPATLTLLRLGLAGTAAKLRHTPEAEGRVTRAVCAFGETVSFWLTSKR